MIVINIATVANIRCIRRSIHSTVSRQEYHFIILVIVNSISNFIFLTFEYSISKETDEFMNPGFSFFLYTLTTKSFRKEFIQAWKDILNTKHFSCCRLRCNHHDQKQEINAIEFVRY